MGRFHDVAQSEEVIDDVEVVETARFDLLRAGDEFRPSGTLAEDDAEAERVGGGRHGASEVAVGCSPRWVTNQRAMATSAWMRLASLRNPWPSSGKRTYSTGTPRRRRPSTTCSASTTGTLVSLAPCSTMVGAITWSMRWMGERSRSISAWVSGSPYSILEMAAIQGSVS